MIDGTVIERDSESENESVGAPAPTPNPTPTATPAPAVSTASVLYDEAAKLLGLPPLTETQKAAMEGFYRSVYPRISEAVEVNASTVHVRETCVCGSTYELDMPAEFRDDLLKGVNTWRKYHTCSTRG